MTEAERRSQLELMLYNWRRWGNPESNLDMDCLITGIERLFAEGATDDRQA